MGEAIRIHYNKLTDYNADDLNQIGAGTDTGFRDIPNPGGSKYYVRKFGTPYLITDVTDIEDPIDVNMTFTVKALNGTTLGSRTGGGAFVGGSTVTAQGCYLEISASGGDVTVLNNILIDTDIDAGGLDFTTAQETIYDGNTLTLYLSDTSSTYYNSQMSLGGGRHTPAVADTRLPFFHPYDPLNDGAWGNDDGIEIVDSETYSFPYKDDGGTWRDELPLSVTPCYLYSTDGQNPIIKGIIGASTEREVSGLFNNATAVFYNENGTNVDTGATGYEDTWHDPYGSILNATTAAGNKGITYVIYGGTGAITNSNIFNDVFGVFNIIIEPDYGYICNIESSSLIQLVGNDPWILGLSINTIAGAVSLRDAGNTRNIYNCNIFNAETNCIENFGGSDIPNGVTIKNNIIYSMQKNGIDISNYGSSLTIDRNIIYNGEDGIDIILKALTTNITNNISYNMTENSYNFSGVIPTGGGFTKNIGYNSDIGLNWGANNWAGTFDIDSNLFTDMTTFGVKSDPNNVTIDYTVLYNNGTDTGGGGVVTNTNSITSDPKYCKIITPFKFGISRDSPAYRANGSNEDIIPELRIIEINEDDIEINGITFDGNEQYNNAIYIADSVNHTDAILKWCSFDDWQGICIDFYDDDTDLDATISNNLIYNGGNGIALSYGGNTIEENIIYNNTKFGIWSDYTGSTFNHNVLYGNQYGLYLESNSLGTIFRNNITQNNSLYGIYSEVSSIVIYSCVVDAVNSNIDKTDSSNIIDNPLFINTTSGSEDFHIKTIEQGYIVESPCKEAASDGYDIGAYLVDYSVNDLSHKKYDIEFNPRTVNEALLNKGLMSFESSIGNIDNWAKDNRIVLPFEWVDNSATSKTQRLKIRYFNSLIPTRANGLKNDNCEFKIFLLPTIHYGTGTGIIDATAKTLTDLTASWIENEKKGWYVVIDYTSGTATGTITASTKILQITPSPTWTNDEWIGYYFPYNGYYYFITDNDADELTLSDPNNTLSDVASIDWEIMKFFKIDSNTNTILTLSDDDSELISGSYEYKIDFINCKVKQPGFAYSQSTYDYSEDLTKSSYAITFEEI